MGSGESKASKALQAETKEISEEVQTYKLCFCIGDNTIEFAVFAESEKPCAFPAFPFPLELSKPLEEGKSEEWGKVIAQAKEKAESKFKCEFHNATFIVPSFYDTRQRKALLQAAKSAGIEVKRLMHCGPSIGLYVAPRVRSTIPGQRSQDLTCVVVFWDTNFIEMTLLSIEEVNGEATLDVNHVTSFVSRAKHIAVKSVTNVLSDFMAQRRVNRIFLVGRSAREPSFIQEMAKFRSWVHRGSVKKAKKALNDVKIQVLPDDACVYGPATRGVLMMPNIVYRRWKAEIRSESSPKAQNLRLIWFDNKTKIRDNWCFWLAWQIPVVEGSWTVTISEDNMMGAPVSVRSLQFHVPKFSLLSLGIDAFGCTEVNVVTHSYESRDIWKQEKIKWIGILESMFGLTKEDMAFFKW